MQGNNFIYIYIVYKKYAALRGNLSRQNNVSRKRTISQNAENVVKRVPK